MARCGGSKPSKPARALLCATNFAAADGRARVCAVLFYGAAAAVLHKAVLNLFYLKFFGELDIIATALELCSIISITIMFLCLLQCPVLYIEFQWTGLSIPLSARKSRGSVESFAPLPSP